MTQNPPPYVSFWEMDIPLLVDGIVKHESAFAEYKNDFRELLLHNNPTFLNNAFYCPIDKNNKPLEVEVADCVVSLSLDGIMINNVVHQNLNAPILNPKEQYGSNLENTKKNEFINRIKKYFSKEQPCEYSIQDVVSNLLTRNDVIEALWSEPPAPYVLLGRVKTVQHDSSSGVTQIGTRPTLIKPGLNQKYESLIRNWEYSNQLVKNDKDNKFLGF